MIVWAQTVGTSAPNPVQRGLQITRGTTGQHAIQWSKKQGGEDANKHEEKNNGQTEKML